MNRDVAAGINITKIGQQILRGKTPADLHKNVVLDL